MKAMQFIKSKGAVENEIGVVRQVRMWLGDITNGEYMLTLERAKKPRSNDQNKLMWVWFNCIAQSWSEATGGGFTAQDVHDAFCITLLPKTLPNGTRIPGSTKLLTTDQMTEFLNKVQAEAATEYGITLLSANDPMYDLWARQYTTYY